MMLRLLLVPAIVLLTLASCARGGVDGCVWTREFVPEAGFAERWTRGEKEQAVQHNRAWREFCAS